MFGFFNAFAFVVAFPFLFEPPAKEKPGPETLPPPRESKSESVIIVPIPLERPDPYYRMSLYARDRYGYQRPKVIYGPNGAYYPSTGEPYPFVPIRGIP